MKNIYLLLITILILGILASFFSCGKSKKDDHLVLEDITSKANKEEGYNDIYLKIIEETKTPSTHNYTAKGLYKNTVVGLKFEVKSNMPKGIEVDGSLDAKNGFISNPLKS